MFLVKHLFSLSCCNLVVGNALVLVFSFTIKGKLARVRFHSWCYVVFGNEIVHVLESELTCAGWPSQ